MPVTHIHSDSQFNSILGNNNSGGGDKLFLVDYSAKWCGPCKMIAPVFEKLSNQYGHVNFQFLHVDVDECADISQEMGVKALPTFIFFKNSKSTELTRLQGADPNALEAKIKEISPKFEASFSGQGQALGGGGGATSTTAKVNASNSSTSTTLSADEIIQIAQANVDYSLSSCCRVGIRFQPGIEGGVIGGGGFKPFLRINSSEKISKLRDFIDSLLELGGVSNKTYELRNSYPPGKLDEEKSVGDGGVAGAVVVVKFT